MKPDQTCQTCKFYCTDPRECRIKAPQLFLTPGPDGSPVGLGVFPPTRLDKWCGEWKPQKTGSPE